MCRPYRAVVCAAAGPDGRVRKGWISILYHVLSRRASAIRRFIPEWRRAHGVGFLMKQGKGCRPGPSTGVGSSAHGSPLSVWLAEIGESYLSQIKTNHKREARKGSGVPGNSHSCAASGTPCDFRRSACLFPAQRAAGSGPGLGVWGDWSRARPVGDEARRNVWKRKGALARLFRFPV